MELRRLRYFVALAEYRHFGRAAQALHIAQPSLSQQIRALEDELGVILFERTKRCVVLTGDGEAFLPYARRMLALADDARAELADRSKLRRGRIRLGTTPTLGGHLLPRVLQSFHMRYPGLELTITEAVPDHLARELDEGRLDLALIVATPSIEGSAFEALFTEEIVAALPGNHPLSGRESVALVELRDESFILCQEGFHLRRVTLDACQAAGFIPRVALSGTNVDTALRFVQAGLGVTLVPKLVTKSVPGVATPAITKPVLRRSVGIAWNPRRYLSKATSALRDFLKEELTQTAAGIRHECE